MRREIIKCIKGGARAKKMRAVLIKSRTTKRCKKPDETFSTKRKFQELLLDIFYYIVHVKFGHFHNLSRHISCNVVSIFFAHFVHFKT